LPAAEDQGAATEIAIHLDLILPESQSKVGENRTAQWF